MKPYYEQDGITIYHGDCREVLPTLGLIDLVVTSPPYNLGGEPWAHLGNWKPGHKSSGGVGITKWRNGSDACNGIQYGQHKDSMPWTEYVEFCRSVIKMLWHLTADRGSIFLNHKPRVIGAKLWLPLEIIPAGVTLRQIIVWSRPGGINYVETALVPMHEWIMLLAHDSFRLKSKAAAGIGDVWRMTPAQNNSHPAPFPIGLPKRAIDATGAQTILDPFMGSGTTLRAAKDLGRRAIGIEIEERYCEIAARRLAQGVFDFGDMG